MKKVIIYTDGACSGNPGPGGWGAILMYNETSKEISGADITIHPEPCSHTDNDHGKCNSSRIREGLKKLQK